MSSAPDPGIYFKSLKNAILKSKDEAVINKTPELITLSFTDLIFSITPDRQESIAFKALNLDFIIDPAGEITLMELEGSEVKFYELGDSSMKNRLYEFLAWRAKVITTSGI